MAVPGRGVNGACSLLERDVLREYASRISFQKRMPEHGAFKPRAGKPGEFRMLRPAASLSRRLNEICRDKINVTPGVHCDVLEFRMKRDGHVGRDGPGCSGPDQSVNIA